MNEDESKNQLRQNKGPDIALFILLLGVILLCSPFVTQFIDPDITSPLLVSAMVFFSIWTGLVASALFFSSRLKD